MRLPKNCQFCGEKFIAKTTTTKYCGLPCGRKAHKERARLKSMTAVQVEIDIIKAKENPISLKEFLTIKEAVTTFGISISTLKRQLKNGKIPHLKIGKRIVIDKNEMIKALKN